ncbi:MAG: M1 family metallopeptidase [Gemmatimonadota bacterium]|nr:MAG: M1 family metallopeptidase [Gemmatimonadota bacterium]
MLGRKVESLALVALAAALVAAAAEPAVPGSEARAQRAQPDVLGYRISIGIGPDPTAFRASTAVTALITECCTTSLHFDLVGLEVDSVAVDGAQAGFERRSGTLRVELGRPAAEGDTVVVQVFYHGVPQDGLIFKTNMYNRPTVFADNWPERARYWFPSVDHPGDKATVEFRVQAPEAWRVVGVGELLEESDLGDGTKLWIWATDRPIPVYTMVVGAGELTVRELGSSGCEVDASHCVRVTQWTYEEDADVAQRLFRRAPEIVAFFDSLIGPFPYEKLALVQSSTRFGGMENSSAIFLLERIGRLSDADRLLAHEIAHQWFGDAVTQREWPHIWLSEGFATYFTSVFFEFVEGDSLAAAQRAEAEETLYMGSGAERPVIDREPENLFTLLTANAYQKGAWVLHMLRQVVGDEAFFSGIRRYYEEHRHATALTADLQRTMEDVSGQDLGWFFEQWLERPGYPQVELDCSWDRGEDVLRVRVHQAQPWSEFRFPLELEAEGDGYELRQTFWVEERGSVLEWALPSEPTRVRADPENKVLGPIKLVPVAQNGAGYTR